MLTRFGHFDQFLANLGVKKWRGEPKYEEVTDLNYVIRYEVTGIEGISYIIISYNKYHVFTQQFTTLFYVMG